MSPRIVEQSVIYQGWGRYLQLKVMLPDGATYMRQLDDHGLAAVVLAYDPARRTALLVRLARMGPLFMGLDPYLTEACAGMIDPGESGETCARREGMEELGVKLDSLERVAEAWSCPSVSTEVLQLFLAPYSLADRVASGGGVAEEREDIEVVETPLAALWSQIAAGTMNDLKTMVLVYALHARRPELFVQA